MSLAQMAVPTPIPELSNKVAIVGLGETDYHKDYKAARVAAKTKDPDYEAPTPESLTISAFERALADSGLKREDIDGLSTSYLYGGPSPADTAEMLGLKPRYTTDAMGILAGPIPQACAAIAAGKCDTIALVYAAATRAIGRTFGGKSFEGGSGAPVSYYYYHPWGWSSQAAHWALAWQYYQATFAVGEEDMAALAIQLRNNAMMTDHAILQNPLTVEDYLASRYVVRPLHLFDICLVNDGAVCIIIRRADMANDLPHQPVLVSGWGENSVKQEKMRTLVCERLRPQFQEAGRQALEMASLSLSDVQHFECYDASSMHLINHVEGHGFVEPGETLDFCKRGGMAIDGTLPVNTAGGMLSGAYMHGWNHVAEITRQLRHEAGARQIKGVKVSMFSLAQTDRVHPIVFTRGE